MNRPIKFRAWEKNLKEMIPVEEIDFNSLMINQTTAWRFIDEVELMQFAGLRDKNSVEIYEGDVLWDAHNEEHGRIAFDEGKFIVNWTTHAEDLIECLYGIYVELAGNIYENPELLERDENEL